MNIDIRNSIRNNFKKSTKEDIIESINGSIKDKDEITLPGLGVFFELLWQGSDKELQDNIVGIIKNSL